MTAPLFNIGDSVYLKESAQNGFLEVVRISHILTSTDGQWTYNVITGTKLPAATTFGDRNTHQNPFVLYYNESELISFCDAADIIEAVLEQRLTEIRQQRGSRC